MNRLVMRYLIAVILWSILAMAFGIMWFMEKQNYNALQQQYTALQKQYQSLLTEYMIVSSNSTLYHLYEQSLKKYDNLVNAFSKAESYGEWTSLLNIPAYSVDIKPGGSVMYPIVVPDGCNATVEISVATDIFSLSIFPPSVYVYVTTLSNMNEATSTLKTPSMLYVWQAQGSGIDKDITLGPGVYVVTILNPITSQSKITTYVYIGTTLHCG